MRRTFGVLSLWRRWKLQRRRILGHSHVETNLIAGFFVCPADGNALKFQHPTDGFPNFFDDRAFKSAPPLGQLVMFH